jgi:DNA-binding transcriptional LysR family regulator
MNVNDWEMIDVLYRTGSLTKASQSLYVSQPALTRRVQQIENEFNTAILVRTSKGVTFTPQGEQLAHYAREMLNRYRELKSIMEKHDEVSGTIRIAASPTQSQFFLPSLLEAYRRDNPSVVFELETAYSATCIRKLQEREVQLVFVRGEHQMSFEREKLQSLQAFAVFSRPFAMEDLPSLPYVSFEADHSGSSIREDWWFNNFNCAPYTAMSVRDINICYEMVRHGLGFGIFFRSPIWVNDPELYSVPLFYKDGRPVMRNDWMCYRENSSPSEPLHSFILFTREYMKLHN